MSCENNDLLENLLERFLEVESELENEKEKKEYQTWTEALDELSEIEDAFGVDQGNKLDGKTILDVGTDCVKPLYIALKFEPAKIIGINEDFHIYPFVSDLERCSNLFAKTKIKLYECSFFDRKTLDRIQKEERIKGKFDLVLVSKTLHHLRTGKCVLKESNKKHDCRDDEKCCKYKFEEQKIFKRLLELGKKVIIYEAFYPHEEDNDKVRGRGGYFTTKEWKETFEYLSEKYKVEFIRPQKFTLNKGTLNKVDSILKKMDYLCFYVQPA